MGSTFWTNFASSGKSRMFIVMCKERLKAEPRQRKKENIPNRRLPSNMLLALYLCPRPSELGRACNVTPVFVAISGTRFGATFSSTFHSARVSHHKPRVLLQVLSYSARVPHHKHRVLLGTSVAMRGSDTINLGSSITVRGSDTINLGSSFTVRGSDTTNLGSSSGPPLECAGPTPRLGFTMFYNSDKRIQSMRSTASSRTSDMFLVPDLQPRTH